MEYISAKTILSAYNSSGEWFGCNYNMNIYKGCSHGCIYCDSRSECYHIENFDKVRGKKNAIEILNRELRSKRKKGIVGTGAMSDPYNPFEEKYKLTREALGLLDRYNFGVAIATKSHLITRDIDLLKRIKRHSPVLVKITVTSADDGLCKILEPNVAVTSKRFEGINKLSANGIFTGILLMPVLPFIEDSNENVLEIVRLAKENGAKFIYPAFGVTLRQNQRLYFFKKLDEYFKDASQKYIKEYGFSYECRSKRAAQLWQLFKEACNKANLLYKMEDIITIYKNEYEEKQISFF
ncbi:SPL family radical SAM protein [Marinisporobacter balticus]|uniref:DNA repair photolyase n=1 Tax=Marinisporobacter balticus TaxID=2018667 RepID=A0A4R2L078_9FIRM|nr:radical SAM protein [Marinisporobacter balticus]TCO79804.1 DNA repair photolyase [Marinisporobacter balticus]